MLKWPLPSEDDREDDGIPDGLPPVVDSHVHVFPRGVFKAVWNWFDQFAWTIRYKLRSSEVLDYLLSRGVNHVVALQYAHKPGIARDLNRYMSKLCNEHPGRVTGMATVFPGEVGCERILKEAFQSGLKGVKLHAHVQCFDMNSEEMAMIYDACSSEGKPLVMHVGREPRSPAYKCDPYELCGADKVERVLKNHPRLTLCVPHLGLDEFLPYKRLIETYDNLWLDTAMALADYFPVKNPLRLHEMRLDRVMYGSDFPNIPYAWDREIKRIKDAGLSDESMKRILGENAIRFFDMEPVQPPALLPSA